MDYCVPKLNIVTLGLKRRRELLEKKDFQKLEELYQSQGKIFGKILLNQMSPITKSLLKADKIHNEPDHNIYIAPVDRIVEIYDPCRSPCQVNADRTNLIKATTFEYILQEGKKLENKFLQKHNLKLNKAVQENTEIERYEADQRLRYALREQDEINMQKFYSFRNKILNKFQNKLGKIEKCYDKHCKRMLHEVIEDSDEKLEYLRLKMQRKIDSLLEKVNRLEEDNKKKTEIKTAEKTVQVDLITAKIKKNEEKFYKSQYSKDTENQTSVLNFINAVKQEQQSKDNQIKKEYIKNLTNLKGLINNILKCFDIFKDQTENKNMNVCCCMIKIFLKEHKRVLKEMKEFETKYNEKLSKFLMKPFCAFVFPNEESSKFFCQCQSSSSDAGEGDGECNSVPKIFFKNVRKITISNDSSLNLKRCKSIENIPCENFRSVLETFLAKSKQDIFDNINISLNINNVFDSYFKQRINDNCQEVITIQYIQNKVFTLLRKQLWTTISNYDFSCFANRLDALKIHLNQRFKNDDLNFNNLDGKKHYFYDLENRKNLPKYLINEHCKKTFIYHELTKEELIQIYEKDK